MKEKSVGDFELRYKSIVSAARFLAVQADSYACGEIDREELENAIEEVELLTGMRKKEND